MPTIVIGDKRVKVGDDFLSLSEADQHKAIDEIAAKIGVQATPAPAANEGMPAPRVTNYGLKEKTLAVPQEKGQPLFTYSPSEALKAAGRGAAYSALTLGGLGDITGGGVGATTPEVKQAMGFEETPSEYVPFEIAGGLVGPGLVSRGANAAAKGARAATDVVKDFFSLPYNKLLEATGRSTPEILNALRTTKTGVESGPQAAAGVGNVEFSRFAKGYEDKSPQIYSDIEARKKALIETQAKRVEETAAAAERGVAADVAAPSQTDVGKKITNIAREEREAVKRDVIRPAYKEAFDAAGKTKIDASGVVADAEKILGSRLADIPAKDMPRTAEALANLESAGPRLIVGPNNAPIAPKFQATLEQLDEVRKAINEDIATASRMAGGAGDARLFNLRKLHDSIDAAVQNSTTLPDKAKSLYADALDIYRTEYAPRFKTGEAAKLFEKRLRNEPGIKPEDVAASFLKGESEAQSFVDLFKNNKQAFDEAKNGIEGIYRKEVIKTGDTIDPTAHANFMLKYGPQIDILDTAGMGLRDRLTSIAQKAGAATAPEEALASARKAVSGASLAEGPKAAQITGEVNDIIKTLKPDDVETISQIAARKKQFEAMSSPKTAAELGGLKYRPLELAKRFTAEIYDELSARVGAKQAKRISELLATPEGTQAFIETAQKAAATREARKALAERAYQARNALATQMGVTGAITNALAPQ